MGIEVRSWAGGCRGDVPVAGQGVAGDAESLGGPGECEGGSVELGFRDRFLVEISFADDQEVAGGVVVGVGVAGELRCPQLEDVAVAVDADVVGDVDPPELVLVVALVLSEPSSDVAVVAEDHGCVVEGHTGDGVRLAYTRIPFWGRCARKNPCSCRAVPDNSHQMAQRQETHGECAYADGCNSADRPTVNPAGRSSTDSEGDAVYGRKEGDGRHNGGPDLDETTPPERIHLAPTFVDTMVNGLRICRGHLPEHEQGPLPRRFDPLAATSDATIATGFAQTLAFAPALGNEAG